MHGRAAAHVVIRSLPTKKTTRWDTRFFAFYASVISLPPLSRHVFFLLSFIEEKIMIVTQSYTEEKCTFRRNPCNFFFGTKKNAVSVQLHRKAGTRWTQQATTTTTNILRTESIRARFHN